MNIKNLLFLSVLAVSSSAQAQNWVEDSVTMGPGYANDVYYSLKNDEQGTPANNNWHLAFQVLPPGPYGSVSVLANHRENVSVFPLHMSASTYFATLSASDTVGKTDPDQVLYNDDTNWDLGAINRTANASDPYDYGWGLYQGPPNHDIVGDSIYLIMIGADAYKLWVQHFVSLPPDSARWEFRIAKFDGSEDTTIKIYVNPDYSNRIFAYYDVVNKVVTNREPDRYSWDILFTKYMAFDLPDAPGVYYPATGVFSNYDVTVAQQTPISENDTLGFMGYNFSNNLTEIGADWKKFDMMQNPPVWVVPDSNYYFIKTKNTNEYYQLQFTGFGGSGNGKSFFRKRLLGAIPSAVHNVQQTVAAFYLAPNPAQNQLNIVLDVTEQIKRAELTIVDMRGVVIKQVTLNNINGFINYTLSIADLPAGNYAVSLKGQNVQLAQKLVVQH